MDDYKIRDYKKGDYEGIMDVWVATGLGNKKRGDNEAVIEHSITIGGKFMIIEKISTGQIIGTSWLTFDGRRLHLHHIGVLPQYQGKGLGKQLTIESIKYSKAKGYQVKLEVHKTNTYAIELYKTLGFKYLGDYDVYIIRDYKEINL